MKELREGGGLGGGQKKEGGRTSNYWKTVCVILTPRLGFFNDVLNIPDVEGFTDDLDWLLEPLFGEAISEQLRINKTGQMWQYVYFDNDVWSRVYLLFAPLTSSKRKQYTNAEWYFLFVPMWFHLIKHFQEWSNNFLNQWEQSTVFQGSFFHSPKKLK